MKHLILSLFIGLFISSGIQSSSGAAPSKKVLVVLSSESKITLKDGVVHPTGFFLPELMGPIKMLIDAGYEPVFANPKGNTATLDRVSDSAFWFGAVDGAAPEIKAKAEKDYQDARSLCESLGICGAPTTLVGTRNLIPLSEIRANGFESFAGILLPGGHAPMEDLWKDTDLREALKYFHQAAKPTGLICHAPIALLAALDDPQGYIAAELKDDRAAMVDKAKGWIYNGYALSVFTTREEQQEETGGSDNLLGGFVQFYADAALEKAGAYVNRADKWKSQVVVDRELITGQNPFSHDEFGKALVGALNKQTVSQATYFRVWQGFKRPDLNAAGFDGKLPGFMKTTVDFYQERGINNYLVAVPPSGMPSFVPDEFALVAMQSEEAYTAARSTPEGQAYGAKHWELFDQQTSKSAPYVKFSDARPSTLVSNTSYDVIGEPIDWSAGYTAFYLGLRKSELSVADFLTGLSKHIQFVSSTLGPIGLKGYIIIANDNYEIAYMNWSSKEASAAAFASEKGKAVAADAGKILDMQMFQGAEKFGSDTKPGSFYTTFGQ